jgi:hypothetical protein
MKKNITTLAMMISLLGTAAYAAPGEYWEVTTKMEMPGMPFAMPANTQKTCIPKGGENDPGKTSGDKDCQMTDLKTVGNKTSWKARCDHDGEIMIGSGEQTTTANSYDGKMQLSGKSGGESINMNMMFSGKHVGGSCDTEEMVKKMKSQACDSSHLKSTTDWINSAPQYLSKDLSCPEQKKELCNRVRKDAPLDAGAYSALVSFDSHSNSLIAQECGMDMPATTLAICKTLNEKNVQTLSQYCPKEAKIYREEERRKSCEGRSYTASTKAEDFKKCMSGTNLLEAQGEAQNEGLPTETPPTVESEVPATGNPALEVLNAAQKLKGLFGR